MLFLLLLLLFLKTSSLNLLQTACLGMIWLTLQSGMMLVTVAADLSSGLAVVAVIGIANLIVFASPFIMGMVQETLVLHIFFD